MSLANWTKQINLHDDGGGRPTRARLPPTFSILGFTALRGNCIVVICIGRLGLEQAWAIEKKPTEEATYGSPGAQGRVRTGTGRVHDDDDANDD